VEKLTLLKGVCPVIPTIFNEQEEIYFDDMIRIINILITNGVHGLTMFGFGSEFYKLSDQERKEIMNLFIKTVDNRVPTIVSVTSHSTKHACIQAQQAQDTGASAIMVLPPFLAKPDSKSILKHIKAILDVINIPLVIQYAPEETKVSISTEVFSKLSREASNELYVKVESKPAGPLVSHLTKKGINVLVGQGGIHFYESLERGAKGVMPGCALYDIFISIYNNYMVGNKNISFDLHNNILPFLTFEDQSLEMFLASEKFFLKLRDMVQETHCRIPNFQLDSTQRKIIKKYFTNTSSLFNQNL